MPFSDSAAPPRLDCSACALPHDRLARARAGSPSRCSSLRPPPLLFAACQGSRLVDVVGLSASRVQCSSAGCDACVRFPTDSACSAKVSLRRPRESESVRRVRPSSQSVESARLVLSSSSRQRPVSPGCPLIVHLPIWLRFLMFLFVIWRTLLALDRPVLRQGGCVFALLSFAGTLPLVAWPGRLVRSCPEMPCASPGLPTTRWSVWKRLRPARFSTPGLSSANGSRTWPRFLASLFCA